MTEEKTDLDFISDPGRILAVLGGSGGDPRKTTFLRKIRFIWPLFRRPTTEADVFEDTSVSGGRLKVTDTGGVLSAGVRTGFTWLPVNDVIGEYFWIEASAVAVAGNVNADITAVAAPPGFQLYKVEQVLQLLVNGAAVANRIPTILIQTGMRQIVGVPIPLTAVNDWQVAGLVNITANQDASVFVPRAPGVVTVNSNGVIGVQAISPLPMYVTADVRIRSTITAGAAGDAHNIIALMKRVA